MVKILVRNGKLYLERAGKEIELESVTIYHHRAQGIYKSIVYPILATKNVRRGQVFTQKSYPLVSITLKKVEDHHTASGGVYYHLKNKNNYINYYVV